MKAQPLFIHVVAIAATQARVAAAFTEWDRRYREEPDRFWSEAQHLLKETPETYGEACAPYFLSILEDQAGVPHSDLGAMQTSAPLKLPAIGADFEGGLYAGVTVHDNTPMALVLLPGDDKLNWADAAAWAEKQGGVLPSRFDSLVLYQNLKSEFKDAWYWSSEVHTGDADYAWVQIFGNGHQNYVHKVNEFRARAVRRVAI